MTPLWLQCHLWMMHLFRQNHLGWLPQAQQVAHHRVVKINPAPLRVQHSNHQEPASLEISRYGLLDDAGLTGIWDVWVGLHIGLFMIFCPCTIFWKGYSVTCSLLITSSVYQAWLTSASSGTPLTKLLRWIPGQGREWTEGHLAQLQLPYLWKIVLR